ncbi:MAG TPA: DM13 domain-containing protein [Dehalococcoidia bacterium]|nr:DM13 domain-containing protein [Dehalococcoidia bacterium]
MPLLNIFGQLENFIADDLYPYRYVITPIAIALIAAGLYVAYRLGLPLVLMRHKVATAVVGVPLLVVAVVAGDYFVSPLWERTHLEEASPLVAAETSTGGSGAASASVADSEDKDGADKPEQASAAGATGGSATSFEPTVVQTGEFTGSDDFHFGRGDALIIETEPGVFTLRFENFSVRNGPDLYVYLSTDPTGEDVEASLNLGQLKATDGAFNYEIPANIDVSTIKSAVVWCRQFSVLFAHAELQ